MELKNTNAVITLLNNHKDALNKVLWGLEEAERHPRFGWFAVNGFRSFLPPEKEALKDSLITENNIRVELLMCAKDVADVKNVAQLFKQLVKPLELKKMLPVWEGIMDRLLVCKDKQEQFTGREMKEWSYINIEDFYMVIRNLQRWEKSLNNIYIQLGGIDIWEEEGSSCKTDGIKTEEKLPEAFKTPKAIEVFNKLVEAGYLDDTYKPIGKIKTKAQMAQFAEIVGEYIGLERNEKWKHFQTYWGLKYLAQQRKNTEERVGKVKGGENMEKEIKAILG